MSDQERIDDKEESGSRDDTGWRDSGAERKKLHRAHLTRVFRQFIAKGVARSSWHSSAKAVPSTRLSLPFLSLYLHSFPVSSNYTKRIGCFLVHAPRLLATTVFSFPRPITGVLFPSRPSRWVSLISVMRIQFSHSPRFSRRKGPSGVFFCFPRGKTSPCDCRTFSFPGTTRAASFNYLAFLRRKLEKRMLP